MINEEGANLKRQCVYTFILGLAVAFCFMVHVGKIHPYPTQYRIVTNSSMYKIQEKNWFMPWVDYKKDDGYGKEVFTSCMLARAEKELSRLEKREKYRMTLKNSGKMKPSPWKPLDE